MTDRYIVTNRKGHRIVHTHSITVARQCLSILGGKIIDTTHPTKETQNA